MIVGAGPAGLVVAHVLRRAGIPLVVLERQMRAELGGRAKAGLIEHRMVGLLESVGIAGDILRFEVENHRCEFRTPEARVILDYGSLTGGRPHYIYPQHALVRRLSDALIGDGVEIRFGATVTGVRPDASGVTLDMTDARDRSQLRGDVVIGCDGPRSVIATALDQARVVEERIPVRWLGVIGEAPPLEPHTIYAAHPRGFTGQMRRGPRLTRYFLEVDAADGLDDWPEQRIRDELSRRLGVDSRLDDVPLVTPTFVELRVLMTEPMQQGRVYLAGDAAHLITPAGGKGMTLAIPPPQPGCRRVHAPPPRGVGGLAPERPAAGRLVRPRIRRRRHPNRAGGVGERRPPGRPDCWKSFSSLPPLDSVGLRSGSAPNSLSDRLSGVY